MSIPAVTPERIAEQVTYFLEGMKNQLLSLPGTSSMFSSKDPKLQQHMKEFETEIIEETLNQMSMTLEALAIQKLYSPSRFRVDLLKAFLNASEITKRKMVGRFSLSEYDVEEDIRRTKVEVEQQINQEFKSEIAFWKALSEQRWDDALIITRAIEIERKDADDDLKAELSNWKQEIGCHTGSLDLFFEGINALAEKKRYSL